MKPLSIPAGPPLRVVSVLLVLRGAAARIRLRRVSMKRPEPFVEHDPRKAEAPRAHVAASPHLLAAGGRAERLWPPGR